MAGEVQGVYLCGMSGGDKCVVFLESGLELGCLLVPEYNQEA